MRLVQFNTHHGGIGSDGKLDTARLASAILALSPDIVTLNEVEQFTGYGNHDVVDIICKVLGPDWVGVFANTSGVVAGHGQGNAILTKLGTPINVVGKSLWAGRSMLSCQIAGHNVVASHISNNSANDRATQVSQIMCSDAVRRISPMLICADWNAHSGNVELAPCYAWYKDAWNEAPTKSSFNGTGATHGSSRIDMVFFRDQAIKSVEVPDTRIGGIFPSDHNPVVVTL